MKQTKRYILCLCFWITETPQSSQMFLFHWDSHFNLFLMHIKDLSFLPVHFVAFTWGKGCLTPFILRWLCSITPTSQQMGFSDSFHRLLRWYIKSSIQWFLHVKANLIFKTAICLKRLLALECYSGCGIVILSLYNNMNLDPQGAGGRWLFFYQNLVYSSGVFVSHLSNHLVFRS